MQLLLFLLLLLPHLSNSSTPTCINLKFTLPPSVALEATPQTLQFLSPDSSITASSITFIPGPTFNISVQAVYDPLEFSGVSVSFATSGSELSVTITKSSVLQIASASQNGWSIQNALASAIAAAALVGFHDGVISACAMMLLPSETAAAASPCFGQAIIEVTVTLPSGLASEALNPPLNQFWYSLAPITTQPTPSPISPLGCFLDNSSLTLFSNFVYDSADMTVAKCASLAIRSFIQSNSDGADGLFIGLQNGEVCKFSTNFTLISSRGEGVCNTTCPTSNETCGGTFSNSVFEIFTSSPTASPTLSPTNPCNCNCTCLAEQAEYYSEQDRVEKSDAYYRNEIIRYGSNDVLTAGFEEAIASLESEEQASLNLAERYTTLSQQCNCSGFTLQPTSTTPTNSPAVKTASPTISGATYVGCYLNVNTNDPDLPNTSRMTELAQSSSLMSAQLCRDYATEAEMSYFGLISGNTCMGGSSLSFITAFGSSNSLYCFWPNSPYYASLCTGAANQFCGGTQSFSLYQISPTYSATNQPTASFPPGISSLGCYEDASGSQSLLSGFIKSTGVGSLDQCYGNSVSWLYFAMQGTNCYSFNSTAGVIVLGTSTACVDPCSANAQQICGAVSGAFSLFQVG